MFRLLSCFLVLGLLCPSIALSESPDPKSGRLADGRAYRTDAQGFRLIDQVAELEATNEELEQKIASLEQEVTTLRNGKSVPSAVAKEQSSEMLQREIELLKKQLSGAVFQCQSDKEQLARLQNEKSNAALASNELHKKLETSRVASNDLHEKLETAREQTKVLQSRVTDLENATARKDEMLTSSQQEVALLKAELDSMREDLKLAGMKAKESEEKVQELAASRASLMAQTTTSVEVQEPIARTQAVPTLKTTREAIKALLTEVNSHIGKRKDLLEQLEKKATKVGIKIQSLVTSDGYSLDALRVRTRTATSAEDLEQVHRGVYEINTKLRDDIGVLERLLKLG